MKKFNVLLMLVAMAISVSFVACGGDDDEESCDGEDIAEDLGCPTDINVIATFCSDGITNSYYTYGGENYDCTGIEASTCGDALDAIAIQVIEDHPECATKKAGSFETANIKLSQMAETLLADVRSKSLCN